MNECTVCYEEFPDMRDAVEELSCEHIFCRRCLKKWVKICIEKKLKNTCPLCRKPFTAYISFEDLLFKNPVHVSEGRIVITERIFQPVRGTF